jgi:hypothetical protein
MKGVRRNEVLGNHRGQSQQSRLELGLRRSPRHGVAAKWGFSNVLRNLAPDFLQYTGEGPEMSSQ